MIECFLSAITADIHVFIFACSHISYCMSYKYVTNRTLVNNDGKETGRLKILVPKESDTAEVEYTCPECSFSESTTKEWKRPFSVKCGKCGFLVRAPKLLTKKKGKSEE